MLEQFSFENIVAELLRAACACRRSKESLKLTLSAWLLVQIISMHRAKDLNTNFFFDNIELVPQSAIRNPSYRLVGNYASKNNYPNYSKFELCRYS